MSFHPAYPRQADLSREAAAIARDRNDIATLRELHSIIEHALQLAGQCDVIHHPDRKFDTTELVEALEAELSNIAGEMERIRRSPVVLGED
jgi:hypothetical protein